MFAHKSAVEPEYELASNVGGSEVRAKPEEYESDSKNGHNNSNTRNKKTMLS